MAVYVNPEGHHPLHSGDIVILHPSWAIGDVLPEGWLQVIDTPRPPDTYTFEDSLVMVEGVEVERNEQNSLPLTITCYVPGIEVSNGVATETWTADVTVPEPISVES